MPQSQQTTIWFDMDGVLSQYNHDDYKGSNPNFKQPHYFASRPVNPTMTELFIKIMTNDSYNINTLGVISKVQPEIHKFIEESTDKQEWINNNLIKPIVRKDKMSIKYSPKSIFTGHNESKSERVMAHLQRPLTKLDILIDDYNANLENWVNNGGTAIKYGLGDKESWKSYSFTDDLTIEEMLKFIAILTSF